MRRSLLALLLFLALPLAAEDTPYAISPASGPASGGTEVTVTGDFRIPWTYYVYFGWVPAVSTRRVDEHTLVAVTPAHLPGDTQIRIFEYDLFIGTDLTFTFTGEVPADTFERVLLPILVSPVQGAFGSEFRTELEVSNTGPQIVEAHGVEQDCTVGCVPIYGNDPIRLFPGSRFEMPLRRQGTPGRFVYVRKDGAAWFNANLRVHDTSRDAENFGTEIPVVRSSAFRTKRFALLHMPRDPRFRNTLRLYADAPTTVKVIDGDQTYVIALRAGDTHFDPAYAQFGNFAMGTGYSDVIIEPEANGPAVWAFLSVTNNETQHITVIAPRP